MRKEKKNEKEKVYKRKTKRNDFHLKKDSRTEKSNDLKLN